MDIQSQQILAGERAVSSDLKKRMGEDYYKIFPDEKEKDEAIKSFAQKMITESEDVSPEVARVVKERFWDLL